MLGARALKEQGKADRAKSSIKDATDKVGEKVKELVDRWRLGEQ